MRIFFASALLVFSSVSFGVSDLKSLSNDRAWLDLLHYRAGYVNPRLSSQVDDAAFFFSDTGHLDPHSELQAFIAAVKEDQQVGCRFPARLNWLSKQLTDLQSIKPDCEEFDEWKASLNAAGASLIFPASYLNSPSSMYGHTFLRLDQRGQTDKNKLLAYSVNFAANADPTDNELVFTWKGLAGGYPGVISVIPYYEKVKEYNNMENRDIWEFKLDLTEDEVDQLVNHLWELKDTRFDYYFFDENCAYRILTLLDVAKPGLSSVDDYHLWAIPSDTVRSLDQRELISVATFRPSDATELKSKIDQLTDEQKLTVLALSQAESMPSLENYSDQEAGMLLEAAYGYTRFMAIKAEEEDSRFLAKRSLSLLSKRSKLAQGTSYDGVIPPEVRDDQGHETFRFSTGIGYDKASEEEMYARLKARIAYHELLDPVSGYIPGAQIEMGELALRIQDANVKVDSFKVLDIQSLTPRDEFIQRLSWRVKTGLDRHAKSDERKLGAYLEAGGGLSYSLSGLFSVDRPLGTVYAFLDAGLRQDDDFTNQFALSVGPSLGYLMQSHQWNLKTEVGYRAYTEGFDESFIKLGYGYSLTKDMQLRTEFSYQEIDDYESTDASIAVNLYF